MIIYRPNRRSIRLRGYDYFQAGVYFVTICTKDRKCLFGDIANHEMALNDAGRMVDKWYAELENKFPDIKCGEHVIMPNHFHAIIQNLGPNPVGADLCVCPFGNRAAPTKSQTVTDQNAAGQNAAGQNAAGQNAADKNGAGQKQTAGDNTAGEHIGSPLPSVIQWFKTMTTNEYIRGVKQNGWPSFPGKLWQRNYYEHIIRNENEMHRIREYITNNPAQWAMDRENPVAANNNQTDDDGDNEKTGIM